MIRIVRTLSASALLLGVGGCSGTPAAKDPATMPPSLGWSDASAGKKVALPTENLISGDEVEPGPGQPVLINYWASTCAPCRKEMPLLQKLSKSGVMVVGVTRDRFASYATEAIGKAGVTYANFQDFDETYTMDELRDLIPTWAVPSSVLLVDGKVEQVHIGTFHTMADLQPATELVGAG